MAYIDGHHCRLVSRRGIVYKSWPYLCEELAHAVRCRNAVLDGEIVCLEPDGRSHFYNLMFRREWPYFMAFDLLWLDGRDVRPDRLHSSMTCRFRHVTVSNFHRLSRCSGHVNRSGFTFRRGDDSCDTPPLRSPAGPLSPTPAGQ